MVQSAITCNCVAERVARSRSVNETTCTPLKNTAVTWDERQVGHLRRERSVAAEVQVQVQRMGQRVTENTAQYLKRIYQTRQGKAGKTKSSSRAQYHGEIYKQYLRRCPDEEFRKTKKFHTYINAIESKSARQVRSRNCARLLKSSEELQVLYSTDNHATTNWFAESNSRDWTKEKKSKRRTTVHHIIIMHHVKCFFLPNRRRKDGDVFGNKNWPTNARSAFCRRTTSALHRSLEYLHGPCTPATGVRGKTTTNATFNWSSRATSCDAFS